MGKNIIGTKWVFKRKHEQDGSIRFKSRIVSKGYMQVPGIDYTEKFAPVASDSTTRIIIALTLYFEDRGWVCELIDIEAVFLEGSIEEPTYLEWPPGTVELGYATNEDLLTKCIRLRKSIYGNVNAALRFYRTYAEHLTTTMKMTRCQSDACVFVLLNSKKEVELIASCHVDDTQIAGSPEAIMKFKEGVRERFRIKELGRIVKHLGLKYSWLEKDGEKYVEVLMPNLVKDIIKIVKTKRQKTLKEKDVPAQPGQILLPNQGSTVDAKGYKMIVGKLMYLVHKLMVKAINAV